MNRVNKAVAIIKESSYFEEWDEFLLQQDAIDQWFDILKLEDASDVLFNLGKELYYKRIPYVIVTEYIDEFFRYYEDSSMVIQKRYQIKNAISKAYLHERLYPEVTKSMIQKTFKRFKDNQYEFSINLSLQDITDVDTGNFIIAILKKYPDVAKRCTFELLEDKSFDNHEEVKKFIEILHQHGVKIALDDFGSGYSNYDTIFNFDIDYIKIDGSLTQSIMENPKSLVLMESIISVAKGLNAKVIVEFVSSNELYKIIKPMGADYLQGYYIGKPLQRLTTH